MRDPRERTFVLLKPETVERNLVGEITRRIEARGLSLVAAKMIRLTAEQAEKLYEAHRQKPFFKQLIRHATSGPSLAMVVEGEDAINAMRLLIGTTDPKKAAPGTIRRDFGISITKNAIHAADSPEAAEREIRLFFREGEIFPRGK